MKIMNSKNENLPSIKKYEAVIFDLDGTLLNTLEDLKDSVNYALKACGMKVRTIEEIRSFVGNGVERLMRSAVSGEMDETAFEKAFMLFKEYYKIHCNDKTGLYPGIDELLTSLRDNGFLMAIVSNKYYEGVQILKQQYFKDYLEVAIGEKQGIRKKPAPDTVSEALRLLNVQRERAVYIGDSEVDIQTAENSKMDCISVTWGFRTKEEQIRAGGKVFVDQPYEILSCLYE